MNPIGKMLIMAGLALIVIGGLFALAGKIPWFGRLPGDICIQKRGFTFYFPIATSILISAVLTLALLVLRRR